MKKPLLFFSLFIFIISSTTAQTPGVQWKKQLAPKNYDTQGQFVYALSKVKNGGYVFVGCDSANFYDKYATIDKEAGNWPMIIRTDSAGKNVWAVRSATAEYASSYTSVAAISSGDFITTGFTGNYVNGVGYVNDLTVTRYSANGSVLWIKTFGGSKNDYGQSIIQTTDGGFAVTGYTSSNDGNVSGNHRTNSYDFWVIKLDETGALQWQKCYGGSTDDKAYDIKQTSDGGYIVVGKDSSGDGNVTEWRGYTDGWIVKLDRTGNLQWQKSIGGSYSDVFKSVVQTVDGGYLVVGSTFQMTRM
jgi:hypothetical protein